MPELVTVPRGLAGVVVTDTTIGHVRGLEGFYHYRQYSAIDLAERRTLEDVWALLIDGALPAASLQEEIAPLRHIPPVVAAALPSIAAASSSVDPMGGLRAALAVAGLAAGAKPLYDTSPPERRSQAMRLCALTPSLLAALYRLRLGLEVVEPRDDLPHAANYLYMITGSVPAPTQVAAIEKYLIATVDHGFNASTFTARVIASTGADLYACIGGALGALSGPLHGGAPSRALDTLDAIGSLPRADAWLRERILSGDRIMGFGHPIYRTEDPRSRMLKGVAQSLGGPLVDFAVAVEARVLALLAELKPGRELHTNVEYYAGVVMELCGLPRAMFTPTFAASRVIGWCANVLEQAEDSKIIRPDSRYVGPPPPQPVPC
ncbi:MAG: citrate synthase/methylcitrate synthase [Hamadaea sp.]|uniref:citrate/2-methylcitrate synthase n=1 Tax=Hamadaea sp. TaxID=2024425 RepID=UPI001792E5C8|nr:citrate/2-methylcitrate synthase [Hamadaea sp.]NUR73297.1 citrate synthase/methylcitrate synthase [Hamadaea sp.]NUT21524.1 citrate synthase/methylcitrate synthase [Hamadaea sp.]